MALRFRTGRVAISAAAHSALRERGALEARALADRAFSRAAGAPLIDGNEVRLLKDARENYPAWLDAIARARRYVHFESYIVHDDETGNEFADALIAAAGRGVRVRLVYDWLGGLGKSSRRFWRRLRDGGVEVRCYNPPQLDAPLGWVSRDHRKMISVDGEVGFVTGLCVGRMWVGQPERKLDPWRDTGVEIRGPAVRDVDRAFASIWSMLGEPIAGDGTAEDDEPHPVGNTSLRIVATLPATAGMLRLDNLVTSMARKRVWLTDAYFAGMATYVQSLRAAAEHDVDVRLLLPNSTDIPLLRPLSRSGYRGLLESGVRIFEWNGTMLHAKTALIDDRWARVGSTNLNIASWLGNCELDAFIEDEDFARQMEQMYLDDLENATEVVLDSRQKVRKSPVTRPRRGVVGSGGGSASRAAAGAVRIGNAIGAALVNRRVLEPVESRMMTLGGAALTLLAVLFVAIPSVLVYPVGALLAWSGLALLYRGFRLHREGRNRHTD